MADKDFGGVSIKKSLLREVEAQTKNGRYRSVAEFVSEAIRLRLAQVKTEAQASG